VAGEHFHGHVRVEFGEIDGNGRERHGVLLLRLRAGDGAGRRTPNWSG
jgi:hypothetical protein